MASRPVARSARRRRVTSLVAAAALTCGLGAAAPAAAATSQPTSAAPGRHPATRLAAGPVYQTQQQASAQAARTRRPVLVTGATTPTSTLTAEPNGTFTLTESAAAVRTKVRGTWRDLDADLIRRANGTYSPAVSSEPLTLSGGGTGPLATMTYGAYSLALTAPVRLPVPVISANTATYADIMPGIALIISVQPSGGFSEVIRVANAVAAANPALRALTFTARTRGLTLKAGADGAIAATGREGQTVFSAPAPQMWDSATGPSGKAAISRADARATRAGARAESSTAAGPGLGAHTARLSVRLAGDRITLVPDRPLLAGRGAAYPEYIDPTWDGAGSAASSWAYVSGAFPSQEYYDTSMDLQVGVDPDNGATSDSFYTLPIPSQIHGAVIHVAYAYFPEVWSYSCTASPVELWRTGTISKSTTYNNQPSWISELGSDNVAYGWSSTGVIGGSSPCPPTKDVSYTITSTIATAAAQSWSNMTVGLKAQDTSDSTGWKQFSDPATAKDDTGENATLSINFAFAPATPTLSTSPVADCATGTSVLGNGSVYLNAAVLDKDGSKTGSLTVTYTAYAAGDTSDTFATNPTMQESVASGRTASLVLSAAALESAVTKYGSDDEVKITWTASVSDGLSGVPSSPTANCSFTLDTAIPGAPNIVDSGGNPGCDTLSYTAGTAASFTLEPNGTSSASAEPTSYTYELNSGNPVTVAASAGSPYSASISITPTRRTNVLSVTAAAAGGNIGEATYCVINATAPSPAVDQDMTGDGIPDLLTVGTATTGGTAAGLWLADGQGENGRFDGTVATTASDIAPLGPQDVGTPSSWDGMRAITGEFTDSGFSDVEAYSPNTGDVYVLPGQGDGSATTSDEQNLTGILSDTSQVSGNTNNPLQLVNAYNVSADDEPYPDQIGLFSDPDSSVGAYLAYFANNDGYETFDASNFEGLPYELANASPDGTMDWTDWTITTDDDTRGGATYTDMWLWNPSTGALYLWELTGLADETPGGLNLATFTNTNPTATLTYTQTEVSAGWDKGTSLATFQATDVDGEAGLVTVTSAGQVQSYAWNGSTLTQANAGTSAQNLVTADHTYLLDDEPSGTVSTADDQPGAGDTAYNLTGSGGVSWNSGDLFSPDVEFTGSGSGYLVSSSQSGDFAPNSSFTVSAWVDLAQLGGTVFSQNGSEDSSVEVYSTTGGSWGVGMNTASTGGDSYATAGGGAAHVGVWTNLTLSYDTVNGADILYLYVNGVEVTSLADASPPSTTGKFLLGADQVNSAAASFLTGQIADVQVWDSLAVPAQPATPNSTFVPVTPVRIMDTRSASKIGPVTGPVGADSTTLLPIDGNTTASLPAIGITAVAVSVTVTGQTSSGVLSVYPADTPQPVTSTLNYLSSAGATNNAIVNVGPDGDIAIYNASGGTVQLIVDLTGYFTTNAGVTGASTFTPLASPTRILDTRNGTGAPEKEIAADGTLALTIAGDDTNGAGLPSSGVTAVALNLTVIPAASGDSGYLTTYPDGVTKPTTSNLTYSGNSQAGTIVIPVGSDGKIDIFNYSGTAINLVGDLSGYFSTSTTGEYYHPLNSIRIIDTRQTTGLASDSARTITNPASVTADNPTLVLNITVPAPPDSGYLQVYPASEPKPTASAVNFTSGAVTANLALVNTSDDSAFAVFNNSAGTVQIVVDTSGYFA